MSRSHASESDAAEGSPASTSSSTSLAKVWPSTDAQRRSARSGAESRSMRAPISASTVSGRSSGCVRLGAAGRHELLEEERVASGSLRDRVQLVGCEPLGCGGDRELPGVLVRERIEPDRERRNRRGSLGRREAARDGAARRAREPGFPLELEREVPKQLGGGLVHPVDVLEQDHRRRSEDRREQRRDDAVEPHPPERGLEVVDLRRRLDGGVEREAQQRDPGHELRRERLEPTAKRR